MTPLKTDRLLIDPLLFHPEDDDIREIVNWLNNPLIVRFSEQRHKVHNLKTQKAFLSALRPEDTYFLIRREHRLIGTVTAYVDLDNELANIGIMIGDHAHWGMGYGMEAWQAVCDDLFRDAHIRKIEAGCMDCNLSMMSICRRYGMTEEGRQKDHFIINNDKVDLVHWGKFK